MLAFTELNKDKIVSAVRATEYDECAFALSRPKKEKEKVEEFILHLFDGYPRYHIVEITYNDYYNEDIKNIILCVDIVKC